MKMVKENKRSFLSESKQSIYTRINRADSKQVQVASVCVVGLRNVGDCGVAWNKDGQKEVEIMSQRLLELWSYKSVVVAQWSSDANLFYSGVDHWNK
jgi:hypothetical protein